MKTLFQSNRYLLISFVLMTLMFILSEANAENETQAAPDERQSTFPPPWVLEFKGSVDASTISGNAWDKGIEKFIIEGTDRSRKEAAKLAYESARLGKLSKHTEIKAYFLVGEYEWALYELEKLKDRDVSDWRIMAAIYSHLGEFKKSLDALSRAHELAATSPPLWRPLALAQIDEKKGDVYAQAGDAEKSRQAYRSARSYYNQIEPKNRGLKVAKPRGLLGIKSKIAMLDFDLLQVVRYADGMYQDHSFGYSGDVVCWVETADGKIQDIKLRHKEKSDLNASKKIPEAILKAQTPSVDVITGATVTSNAIQNCVFEALKHAAGIE